MSPAATTAAAAAAGSDPPPCWPLTCCRQEGDGVTTFADPAARALACLPWLRAGLCEDQQGASQSSDLALGLPAAAPPRLTLPAPLLQHTCRCPEPRPKGLARRNQSRGWGSPRLAVSPQKEIVWRAELCSWAPLNKRHSLLGQKQPSGHTGKDDQDHRWPSPLEADRGTSLAACTHTGPAHTSVLVPRPLLKMALTGRPGSRAASVGSPMPPPPTHCPGLSNSGQVRVWPHLEEPKSTWCEASPMAEGGQHHGSQGLSGRALRLPHHLRSHRAGTHSQLKRKTHTHLGRQPGARALPTLKALSTKPKTLG